MYKQMRKKIKITTKQIKHVASLAKLKLEDKKINSFKKELSKILDYMSKIQNLKTENVSETSQVTGQENVLRKDVVEKKRILPQSKALSNAPKTHKGYFLIEAIFNN